MSARPPKYDWPIKWPEEEKLTRNWLGLILFIVVFATVVPAIWVIVRFYVNIGLTFIAALGALAHILRKRELQNRFGVSL